MKRPNRRWSAHGFFMLSALLLLLCANVHAQAVGDKAKLNNVTQFDGAEFDVGRVAGKVTLLYFWASWCPICRREMPILQKHYLNHRDRGFEVLAINFRDKDEAARRLLQDVAPIDYPVAKINDDYRSDYPRLMGTPTWYLIDRAGVIRKIIVGEQVINGGWSDGLKREVDALLAIPSR